MIQHTRNLRLIRFFRFRDIQLYMTEPPNSSELETVAVESIVGGGSVLFFVLVCITLCHS